MKDQQRAFVREYVKDFNATQAALRAGYSPKNAGQQGARLLKNAKIKAAVEKLGHKAADTKAVLALSELQEWWSDTIRGQHPDARFTERQKASELLAKSLGGFVDRTEHSGGIAIEFLDADD